MALAIGTQAPDFTLYSDEKQPFTLSEQAGQPVVLLFYPGAFTSVCTDELNTVSNDLDAYGRAQVVGISTDSPFVQAEFKKANGFQITLLSDHEGAVSAAYESKYDHDFTPMKLDRIAKRAAYVIDGDGVIRYAEVLENAGEMPNLAAIQATVNDLS